MHTIDKISNLLINLWKSVAKSPTNQRERFLGRWKRCHRSAHACQSERHFSGCLAGQMSFYRSVVQFSEYLDIFPSEPLFNCSQGKKQEMHLSFLTKVGRVERSLSTSYNIQFIFVSMHVDTRRTPRSVQSQCKMYVIQTVAHFPTAP